MGAQCLRRGDCERAVKLLGKSLKLYPLPGVEALLSQANAKLRGDERNNNGSSNDNGNAASSNGTSGSASSGATSGGAQSQPQQQQCETTGRSYTDEHVRIVKQVLSAKEGGRGAHYRVLGLNRDATEAQM